MKSKIFLLTMTLIGILSYSQYRQPTQYRDPEKLDISVLGNAATTLQNRYNDNVERVEYTVKSIIRKVNNLDLTDEQKEEIIRIFKSKCIASVNNQNINYSSNSETESVISYFYESINKIIENVTN